MIDLEAVKKRIATQKQMNTAWMAANPDSYPPVSPGAIDDISALIAEVERLRRELDMARETIGQREPEMALVRYGPLMVTEYERRLLEWISKRTP